MEHRIAEPSSPPTAPAKDGPQVSWRDLREWIALLERNNELQRINKPVDADEELGAITYMATRNENSAALLFENGDFLPPAGIVDAPSALTGVGPLDGLDAREAWPPLLRAGVM